MEEIINLSVKTKYGEDLYVMVYSAKWNTNYNHYEVYKSPEFLPYYIPNIYRSDSVWEILKQKYVLIKYALIEWLRILFWQFKCRRWSLELFYLACFLEYPVIEVYETFRDQYQFSIKGQLYFEHPYIENCYPNPSQEYLEIRIADLIEEYLKSEIEYYQTIAKEFIEWKKKQIDEGNHIYYICSLNT